MAGLPKAGQKTISLAEWKRFTQVADWWDRTHGHKSPTPIAPDYGHDRIVKTPAAGIPGRAGDTIYSAKCTKCVSVDTATAGEKSLSEITTEETQVYNLSDAPIPGATKIPIRETVDGLRYAVGQNVWRYWWTTWTIAEGANTTSDSVLATAGYYADHPGFALDGTDLKCLVGGWYPISIWIEVQTALSSVWPVAGRGYHLYGYPYIWRDPNYVYPGDTKSVANVYYVAPPTGVGDTPQLSSFYTTIAAFVTGDWVGIGVDSASLAGAGGWAGLGVIGIGPRLWSYSP